MGTFYEAILENGRVEWIGKAPALTAPTRVRIEVSELPPGGNGKKIAQIMREIAQHGGIPSIPDPSEWQREIRKDRPLPGRD